MDFDLIILNLYFFNELFDVIFVIYVIMFYI
jgi:hypothetical protein